MNETPLPPQTLPPGTRVMKSGYEGTVVSEYLPGMYVEVRLPAGMVVVPRDELTPVVAYRVFWRGGTYQDVVVPPAVDDNGVWAVINLDILDGGDAYQALLRTITGDTYRDVHRG